MKTLFFSDRRALCALLLVLLTFPAAAQTLPAHYRQTNNIPYVTGGQSRQWLDLYHIPTATNPTPVVVWVHGGGWLTGDENSPRALALTNHNIAVAAISYRYTTNAVGSGYPATLPHPAQIQDVKAALRWLRANAAQFNLDPARIGIWGYSSGGHLAALAGTTGHTNLFDVGENLGQSSAVLAVADMSGPANIGLATANQATENFFTLLLGAPAASNPSTLATVNPMSHVRLGAPPFLIIHGESDPSVAIAHSEQLHTALTNAGVSSLFVRLPGIGHTIPATQDPLTAQWLADRLNSIGATNPPPADTLRAHEPFAAAAGTFLHGQNGGTGFAAAWTVLGFDSNANQFRNASAAPLASGNLLASGNYGIGGYNNFTANRRLDVAGAFATHAVVGSNPAVIGRDGTTLWLAALVRKDSNDDVQLAVTLANGDDMGNVNNLRVGMGYYGTPSNNGGQRYWTLLVNNPGVDNFTFVRGNVPITPGVAALLVVRIQFGATDQIDLFVNPPPGGSAPVTPNATRSTTGGANILFRTVAFWSSAGQNNAALDELRLGDTFAAVTPTTAPVATPGTLQFSAATYSVTENAGTATITITRAGGTSGAVGVSFATSNGSATAGGDYTGASGTLSWTAGDAANKSFAITIANDTAVEGAETVNLSLSNPTGGATLGAPASATLTINDDDLPPFTDDLAVLSDEFDSAATLGDYQRVNTVEGWNADKLEARDINTSRAGRMTMLPRTGGWFNDYIGELTFRPVSGDFVVTTEVIPRNRAGTAAPSGEYSLAGLMMRTPTGHTTGATGWPLGQQNYVFLSMGAANNPGTYQFEVKNTVNSASGLTISSAPSSQTELQIARLGGAVITLRRDLGGQWLVHRRFARADFPAAVQVGLVAYTDWLGIQARFPIAQPGSYLAQNSSVITDQNPGLRAEFEYLRYHRPQIPANLAGRDFSNPAQVTDAELLAFLGANANAPGTNAPVTVAPALTTQPQSQTVDAGANVTFSVTATGTPTPQFQWRRNGTNLPGANAASLSLTNVATSDSGAVFSVVLTNSAGTVTSSNATLTVNALPPGSLGGFPNVTQVPGRLLTPLLAPQQGRTAVLAFHNRWLYSVPEAPSSQPNSDLQVRRWNLSDLANVREVEQLGVTQHPVMAHGYLFLGPNLVLGPNWPPAAPWSFRAQFPGVNVRTSTPEMQGVFERGHLYQPWNISPTYWSYASNDQQGNATLSYDGQPLATFDHLGRTGGLIGHPFIVGNILIYASDQSRTGVATYDISDPRNPVLLDVLKTGGAGGYWPELWGGDGKLYVVFPYREPGNGMRVVDVTDPAHLRFVADVPLPGSECMYVQFQDEFAFLGSHKVDMRTLRSVLTFDARGQRPDTANVDTSQFALPIGNLLVTGGSGPYQGMAVWAHQAGPDLRGPSVSYHIPRASQANYPTSAPISLLIHETLRSESIEFGTNLIVRPLGGQPISARWVLAFDDTLTISPDGGLLPNTTYEVIVVGGGIKDVADNGIEPLAFTFSTGGNVLGNRAPVVDSFTVSAYPAATNQVLTFTASASDPDGQTLEYRFDFGDSTPRTAWSANPTATYSYATNGHYPATVQVRDPAGLMVTRALNVTVLSGPAPGLGARSSAPIALHSASRQVWVVNPDNNTVQTLHADTLARGTERGVGADPRGVAFDAAGNAWVTCHKADRIDIVSAGGGAVQSLPVRYGSAPFGIVTSPDGGTAYVSMYGSGEIVRFNTATRTATGTLAIGPTPRALALSADGSRLYVTRFLSLKDDAEVWEVDTASLTRLRTFRIHKFGGDPHRDTSAEGMGVANYLASAVITRDGTRLLIAATKPNTEKGTARGADLDDDNTVRNLVFFIDLATGAVVRTLDIDNSDSASGLALSPLGDFFFTTLQGNNDLAIFDAFRTESSAGLGGLLTRRGVGRAPQGVCVDPVTRRAFVMNLLSRDVSVLELDGFLSTGALNIASTNLATAVTELVPPAVKRGKEIFYHAGDRRMSAEGYISCATCHVDGGHDGRVWDFSGRGEGLRNTITLHGRSGTAHGNVHWSGNFDEIQDFEHDIRSAFGGTGFLTAAQFAAASTPLGAPKAGMNADLDALAAYVASLGNETLPRSPHRAADGSLTSAAQAGAAVFAAQNCASCHAGSTMTDRQLHNVGTLRATSGPRLGAALTGIDTPTLRGVASTAPYFHDGSAATLADVFTIAGGTLLPAELALPAGASQVVSNDLNYYLNFDETAFGHAFVGLGSGGTLTFANVNGGPGGMGAIEIRYATAYRPAPLSVRVNGTNFSATLPLPFNEPAWRMVNWLTYRLENIPLLPGPNNTLVLEASTTDLVVDHLVVSTPDDLALAAPHRRVLALPPTDRDNLVAYLRELDGSPLPGQPDPPVITAPPVSALVLAGTNHTFSVTAAGTPPLTYQWLRNTVPLPDATNSTLTLAAVTRASSGNYAVQITGPGGTNTSAPATLRVLSFPQLYQPQRLGDGTLRLSFHDRHGVLLTLGDAPNFEVWVSPDLPGTNWIRLLPPLTLTNGILTLDDPDAPLHPRRFYRVLER